MGAFFLYRRGGDAERRLREAALASLAAQGFGQPRELIATFWAAYVCGKYSGDPATVCWRDSLNFAFCCGTFFYAGKTRVEALEKFTDDHWRGRVRWEDLAGPFCVVLCRDGRLELIPDRVGVYKIYHDEAFTLISSSFLAALEAVPRPKANQQAIYEYVFQGASYDGRTVVDQVRVLEPRKSLRLADGVSMVEAAAPASSPRDGGDRQHHVALIHDRLRHHFRTYVDAFGSNIDTALSGGYDSRLLLALLREHGARPRVHVYGHASDPDVVIAKAIAKGENFTLSHVDKALSPTPTVDEFPAIVGRNFQSFDGCPTDGIIDRGADAATRSERASAGVLALNGGGGEIFRNFFYLRDRPFTVRQLLHAFFSQFDPQVCSYRFDEEEYLDHLARAILRLLGRPADSGPGAARLTRSEIELLYPYFRCGFWMGRNNSINNRFGYFATPFIEPELIALANAVPLHLKNHGILEAALIHAADPALAAYPSSYGASFDRAPSLRRLVKDHLTLLRPTGLRRLSYRVQNRLGRRQTRPRLLQKDYLAAVLDVSFPRMRHYFNVERVQSGSEMNRICTLEYLFERYQAEHP